MADEQYTNDSDQYTENPNPNPGQNLEGKGLKNQVAGKAKEVGGKIESGVGKLTNDQSTQAKGKAKEVEGKVQQKGGQVEKNVGDAINPNNP